MERIAVIGSGISGLAAARRLHAAGRRITLFEAGSHFGGHANTVDIAIDGIEHGVDTGFLVFNHRTYPKLVSLFGELGVATAPSDMSFSVQSAGVEWAGSSLGAVFAQRRNLLRPSFWRMLADIARFNRLATELAQRGGDGERREPVADFLDRHGFGRPFRQWYLLPMIACIWSCPTEQMLRFPIETLVRFCHNHGLLQIDDRPQWHTVRGGSRHYVRRIVEQLPDARLSTPVLEIVRRDAGVGVRTLDAFEHFDQVVMACHSDEALALLGDGATPVERHILGAIRYQSNRALLHTDASLLPRRHGAWAAWNYEASDTNRGERAVCLHYLLQRLQPLPWRTPVIVTLNPLREPRPESVLRRLVYAHPVFDQAAIEAQRRLPEVQGQQRIWFCGAWTGYGFHEDGLASGLAAAEALLAHSERPWQGAA
ncbi:NAD(P)/FAD-dependent oxidoreductase [Caldimonas sp. KR1-144]|uniref:NAD(P)/FAD-dependent oxidoreductase n=1 Tax=Caldimonas sp. KR1-144 TaxID=3400911 RepID=UPI003C10BA08